MVIIKRSYTNLNVLRRRAGGFHLLRYGWIWLGALALLWGAGARNRPRNVREESRPPLSPLRSERNILLNGGFEDNLQNWTYTGERIEDSNQAHSGRACVTGAVTQPNQTQFLRQKVTLRTDARYRLQLWARGTNQTKIAVWLRQGERRWNLSQLENMPVRWQEFVVPFSAPEGGAFELELVAPSSHNAPPGRVWVDDVALYELVLPPAVSLTQSAEVADFPALASDGQGRLYTAWVEFKEGKDKLWLASGRAEGERLVWESRAEVPLPGESVESVSLAGGADGAWGCAAVETPKGWDLLAFRAGRNGLMDKPWLLMQDAATDIRPALAVSGSRVAAVWESNRDGKRQIYAAMLESGQAVTPQRLSDGSDSSYFPALTGDGAGRFWAAWEAVEFPAYRTSSSSWQRVLTARIGNAGLESPANIWNSLPLWGTNPRLLRGRDGRLYLVVRHSQGQSAGWEVFQTRGSYEYDGTPRQAKNTVAGHFIQDAWAKGVIIGVIASPDHGGGMGKAAVFAPELTREAILDACRARHTYGTTGAKIFLDVRVNGRLMGEKLPLTAEPVQVDVRVSAPADIEAVEVCKNNRFVYTHAGGGKEITFTFRDSEPPRDGTYYYVRVRQQDGEIACSSPVWFFDKAKLNEKQHREGVREMWE